MIAILIIFALFFSENTLISEPITGVLEQQYQSAFSEVDKLEIGIKIARQRLELIDYTGMDYAQKALESAEKLGLMSQKAEASLILGIYWKILGEYADALNYINQAKDIFEANNQMAMLAESYRTLGETYRAMAYYEKALINLSTAASLFNYSLDTLGLAKTMNRFGAVFYEMYNTTRLFNNLDSSFAYCMKAIRYAEKVNDLKIVQSTYTILGATNIGQGDYSQALSYLTQALEIARKINAIDDLSSIYINIASVYHQKRDYESSNIYADSSLTLARKLRLNSTAAMAANTLYLNYEKLGDYRKALHYLGIDKDLTDSIQSVRANLNFFKTEIKHLQAQKERELEIQKEQMFYQTIIFIIILLFAAFISFSFYQKNSTTKRINQQLNEKNDLISEQKDQLIELNNTKDKFFSIISHDLKNPIGTLKSFIELLKSDYDKFTREEIHSFIIELSKSAQKVYSLLEELLQWSRIKRGAIKFYPHNIAVYDFTKGIIALFDEIATNKQVTIRNLIPKDIKIVADMNMFSAILRNLLSNAIKFSHPNGEVTIGVNIINNEYEFFVKDNGIGIEPSVMEKLFLIGNSITSVGTNGEIGTGLGLILCREFVDIHKGRIWAASKPGFGATIFFTIPKLEAHVEDEELLNDLKE
jgi:signal transduction histidine kinase